MVQDVISSRTVTSIDPVWQRICDEAQAIARHEPNLGGFIFETVLNHHSFEESLCQRLAQRLGNDDVGAGHVLQAFENAVEASSEIGIKARADILAITDRDPACERYIEPLLYFKGFQAVQIYRMAHQLWLMGNKDFALYLQSRVSMVFGVDIHPAAEIGQGIMIDHAHAIVVGATAVIEDNVSLMHGVTLGGTGKAEGDRHPKVRHGVLVGAGASILGNIEIGHCCRIAAGSVVLQDVPPNRTVAGVPAKIVGYAGCVEPARAMDHMILQED